MLTSNAVWRTPRALTRTLAQQLSIYTLEDERMKPEDSELEASESLVKPRKDLAFSSDSKRNTLLKDIALEVDYCHGQLASPETAELLKGLVCMRAT